MPFEAVVRQNAAEVWIIGEINPEQIPGLALPPAGAAEESNRGRHRVLLVGFQLEADALVQSHTKEVVHELEAQRPIGIVDAANVTEHREGASRVIAQKLQNPRQGFSLDPRTQFIPTKFGRDQRIGEFCRNMLGKGLEFCGHGIS